MANILRIYQVAKGNDQIAETFGAKFPSIATFNSGRPFRTY